MSRVRINENSPPAGGPRPVPADDLAGHPLIARLTLVGQWLRQRDAEHRWVLDLAVVVLMYLVFCVPDFAHRDRTPDALVTVTRPPLPAMIALQVGLVVPLFWRRRAPTVTFYLIAAVFVVQWSLGALLRADVALLVAVYSLVLHGQLSRLPWAGLTVAAAMTLVAIRVDTAVSIGDALFFLLSAATAAAALGFTVRLRRAQLGALRERAAQLEIERDQRTKLATANERTRVAREMHDIVGHNLSVIVTLADGGAYAANVNPERGTEALRLIGDTGRQALTELRRVLGALREHSEAPDWNPQPDIAAIGHLCDQIRAAGPQVVYHSAGDMDALDQGVQLTAYRIVQEAFTNSLRYAGPQTRIHLALTIEGTRLRIIVHDAGPPGHAHPPEPPPYAGQGLIGMRERAAIYDGTAAAGPDPRGGWTVRVTLNLAPLPASEGDTL